MTTTYDPHHPAYLVAGDVREEMTRVFDVCRGCRRCVDLCASFPTMFELLDEHAAPLTPAQQDQVVDECFHCKLCYVNCPYVPGQSDWAVDFPRLMLWAGAMRHAVKEVPAKRRITDNVLGRTDLLGKLSTRIPANTAITEQTGRVPVHPLQVMARAYGIPEESS